MKICFCVCLCGLGVTISESTGLRSLACECLMVASEICWNQWRKKQAWGKMLLKQQQQQDLPVSVKRNRKDILLRHFKENISFWRWKVSTGLKLISSLLFRKPASGTPSCVALKQTGKVCVYVNAGSVQSCFNDPERKTGADWDPAQFCAPCLSNEA